MASSNPFSQARLAEGCILRRIARFTVCSLALVLVLLIAVRPNSGTATGNESGPPLSNVALLSRFAQENDLARGANAILSASQTGASASSGAGQPAVGEVTPEIKVNQDFSLAPQNETTIAVNPSSPNMILAGANDYRLGVPVGAAFYVSTDSGNSWKDGFPPFPMLAGAGGDHAQSNGSSATPVTNDPDSPKQTGGQVIEPPSGTGDPVIAFGKTRSAPDLFPGSSVAYYGYLGVSASHCEQGIFVSRSLNGLTDAASARVQFPLPSERTLHSGLLGPPGRLQRLQRQAVACRGSQRRSA